VQVPQREVDGRECTERDAVPSGIRQLRSAVEPDRGEPFERSPLNDAGQQVLDRLPAASGAYVQPSPRVAPERASTTTIVVESHSRVPSDSGASLGIVNAETSSASTVLIVPAAARASSA
jgi:hypothetical protein